LFRESRKKMDTAYLRFFFFGCRKLERLFYFSFRIIILVIFFLLVWLPDVPAQEVNAVPQVLAPLSVLATTTNPSCTTEIQGSASGRLGDGSITATASGGTPPYTYTLTQLTPPQNNGYFPAQDQGHFQVVVEDATGATASTSGVLSYTLPQPSMLTHVLQLPSSCVSKDGSLQLEVTGGTPPYAYSTDGGQSYHASNAVSNLEQGYAYVFVVKDANGCITASSTSTEAAQGNYFMCTNCCPLYVKGLVDKASCSGDGQLSVLVTSGVVGQLQYSLDGSSFQNAQDNPVPGASIFPNLSAGIYHVYARDAVGNIGQSSFMLANTCNHTIGFVTTDPACGQNNGSVTVTASFGVAPYSYTMDGVNFQSSPTFTGLIAGNYSITARDFTGESASGIASLLSPCPTVTTTSTDAGCRQMDGTLTAKGSGGVAPYTYSINGTGFQAGDVFTGLAAGHYTVTVKDDLGQKGTVPAKVSGVACFQLQVSTTGASCGKSNGVITITASGGTPPYSYSADGVHFAFSNVLGSLPAGDYPVTVLDFAGGTAEVDTRIADVAGPQIDQVTVAAACNGGLSSLTVSASGGTSPLQYSIDGTRFQDDNKFSDIYNQIYPVLVRDANGCIANFTKQVTGLSAPAFSLGNDTILCGGQTLLLNLPADPHTEYTWQDGSKDLSFLVDKPGVYSVKALGSGCEVDGSITVSYRDKPVLNLPEDTTGCFTRSLLLDAASPGSDYQWQNGSTLPQFTVSEAGRYSVRVSNQCGISAASVNVKFKSCDCHFSVPNAFTPNNDGKNDLFTPKYDCLLDHYQLKIFNRWGQQVYVSSTPGAGWNGNTGGSPQPEGTYIWFMEYHDVITGKTVQQRGTVVLIR
jgi:gliding motility-associated-like protein